jgi:alkylation response protein AidB-like acyl-CoA dehydrogenase
VYQAPLKDIRFVLEQLLAVEQLASLPPFGEYSSDLGESILSAAGTFASEVLDPINTLGDRQGARLTASGVTLPAEFRDAYRRFVADGWPLLGVPAALGGQGMPLTLATAVEEIWCGANMAFMLCPMLGHGAIESLQLAGSPALQAEYLPKLVSGEWTGTMNLTESQAGSDLALIRMRAVPDAAALGAAPAGLDRYRLFGQKIFITYGEHDLADNIVHLVLARIDGAPDGIRGISLFLVPRRLRDRNAMGSAKDDADDGPWHDNDVRCVSLEHKLGIHASPTCVMAYGEREGAIGYLVGEAHHGVEYMFIMMNRARLAVGMQGVAMGERALQQATRWGRERLQGRAFDSTEVPAAIHHHPDVRRMLLTLKSEVEAMRALALYAALQSDIAHGTTITATEAHTPANVDAAEASAAQRRADLLIPIVKGFCTERANDLTSLALQVHGGMGYIEETGVAQTLRDARISAIYEGTTGIQANDLLGRKLARDQGAAMFALLDEAERELAESAASGATVAAGYAANTAIDVTTAAATALAHLRAASTSLLGQLRDAPAHAHAVAVPYLMLCGVALGGWLSARAARIAAKQLDSGANDKDLLRAKLQTVAFYSAQRLPEAAALRVIVEQGGAAVAAAEPALL